jgi:hypothetical protein
MPEAPRPYEWDAAKWWDDNKRCVHVDPVTLLRCVRTHRDAESRVCDFPHAFVAPPDSDPEPFSSAHAVTSLCLANDRTCRLLFGHDGPHASDPQ